MYKTLNSFYCFDPKDIFMLQLDSATRGHQMKPCKPRMSRSIGQHFFSFRVIQQWNDLPQEVVLAKTISSFKHLLDKHWKETALSKAFGLLINFAFLLSIIYAILHCSIMECKYGMLHKEKFRVIFW